MPEQLSNNKQPDAMLHESEECFRAELQKLTQMLDLANNTIIIRDLGDRITYWNYGAEKLYGWKKEEALGKNVNILLQTVLPKPIEEIKAELLAQGYWQGELIDTKRDGIPIIVASRWTLQYDKQGNPTAILEIGNDITPLKQAAAALQRAKQELELRVQERTAELRQTNEQLQLEIIERQQAEVALRQSEQRYRSLVTATSQIVWLTDAEGRTLGAMSDWEAFTGQPQEQMQGWGWLKMIHPNDQDRISQSWSEAVATKTLFENEYRLRIKDGTYRDFLVKGVPVLDTEGNVQEWVGTNTDITDRKRAEQVLRNAKDELENRVRERTRELAEANTSLKTEIAERIEAQQKLEQLATELKCSNQELEQFAYVASHDLQEPLRAVTGYTQLLAQEYQEHFDESAQQYMGYVVDGATRMQQLIRDLLTYSRVGTRNQEFTLTDCNRVLNQALDNLQVAIADALATITHEPLPTLIGDNNQLVQLFQNLISNAIKFHRKGEPPQVHIEVQLNNGKWQFAVRDKGIGIKPQYLERIFIIFKRLHTRKEFSGTGIGLAICKKIVERHGGRIWVESQAGIGTTFYFTIPTIYEQSNSHE